MNIKLMVNPPVYLRFLENALTAVVLTTMLGSPLIAEPIAYAAASFDELYTIDMSTGSVNFVGNMGPLLNGLAMDSSGNLYGHDSSQALWDIDTDTAMASTIGDGITDTNTVGIPGLDFNGSTLTGLDDGDGAFPPAIFTFDASTGDATLSVELQGEVGRVGAMTIMDSNTAIVATELGNSLLRINLTTGAISLIATGVPRFLGLEFLSDGNLYGLTTDGGVYTIDPMTGAYTQIWDTGDQYWISLAGISPPTPTSPPTVFVEDVRAIARLYSAAFDRLPKVAGLNHWVNTFESGKSIEEIARKFYESPEFNSKYGPLNNRQFVMQLFSNVLGRDGGAGGIDFWESHLDNGVSRAKVLAKFADSPENISKTGGLFSEMRFEGGLWTF